MNTIKPKFNGKLLIEIPKEYQTIGFLEGDFGKSVLKEYKGRSKLDFNDNKYLNVLFYDNKIDKVTGSSDFAVVLMNTILNEEGLRTPFQSDLEKALKLNALNLNGTYEDTALILRNEKNPNSYLAKHLMKQINAMTRKANTSIMISLNQLDLVNDQTSEYGLAFKLKEDAKVIYAPILNKKTGNFSSEDMDEKTGLPTKLGNGKRTLYTMQDGLSRLCLCGGLDLNARYDDLADSYSGGRVVVVSGEATEKFSEFYTKEQILESLNKEGIGGDLEKRILKHLK